MAEQNGRSKTVTTTASAAIAAGTASAPGREFVEGWTLAQTLGEGAYGEVKLLINRQSGEAVAMKMVDLKKHPDASTSVKKEVCIQKALNHPHILRFFGQRSQGNIEYIFLEYAAGGELFDRIEPDVGMAQQEAQRYFKQLLSGVEYLHMRGIAHRDLKPENLLLDDNDNIKISDFGMATIFRANGKERLLDKRCGTLPYVAPEVLTRSYHATPADIWSCGIILITMLAGELPWDHPTLNCPDYMVWKDNSRWTTATPWKKLDTLVLSLLRKVLTPNANARPSIEKMQEHKWCRFQFNDSNRRLSNGNNNSTLDTVDCMSPRAKRLRSSQDLGPSLDDSTSRMYQSQPVPSVMGQCMDGDLENLRPGGDNHHIDASRNGWSFSQPAALDNMILCTQLNPTQGASQNVFQRLVRRMTRFFVTIKYEEAVKRLTQAVDKLGYTSKVNDNGVITVSTMDRRKLQLVFKANPIEMDGKLLLDFRLSKGCGLEFKRSFVKIKQCLGDIILKGPVSWPIFVATNTVP